MVNLPEQRKEIKVQSVRGLMEALSELINLGYGEHSIYRADVESGPCEIKAVELYNTEAERLKGELTYDYIFIIV